MTMGTRSATNGRDASPDDTILDEINDLMRQLVGRVDPGESGLQLGQLPRSEEIVFDADVDGVRYLLVRLPKPTRAPVSLSPREHEIVRMVAQGYPNKMVAGVLSISSWTVCTHLRRIFAKLGVTSRAAMVARLMEEGSVREHFRASEKPPELPVGTAKSGLKTPSPAYGRQSLSHRSG
jgi:two-component system, NarL family, nitrate/nitrite response regulator NarL